jgi:pimeloyl-ACP methyl ester carboxylesterase
VLVDPQPRQQIRFCATPAGARVAYATAGRGPALLVPAAWIGHLELAWQDPAVRAFYAPLAAHRTVVRYDKPNCGLSDPWPGPQTLETDLEVLRVVADELRLDRFDLLGISMAAPVSAAFAARHPDRVGRLVLYGGYANGRRIASTGVAAAMVDLVQAHWGLGSDVLADVFLPDGSAEAKAHFARLQRDSATTGCCTGAATGPSPTAWAAISPPASRARGWCRWPAAATCRTPATRRRWSARSWRSSTRRPAGRGPLRLSGTRARSPRGSSRSRRWSPRG